jgi:hypothetical protein
MKKYLIFNVKNINLNLYKIYHVKTTKTFFYKNHLLPGFIYENF